MTTLPKGSRIGKRDGNVNAWCTTGSGVAFWMVNHLYVMTPDQAQAIAIVLLDAATTARGKKLCGVHLMGEDDDIAPQDRITPKTLEEHREAQNGQHGLK